VPSAARAGGISPWVFVVDAGQVEQPPDVDPPAQGAVDHGGAVAQVLGPLLVVVGPDPELGHQQRGGGKILGQASQNEIESLGPDAVDQRRDGLIGRVRHHPTRRHTDGGVVGEADEVEGAGQIGPLDRCPSRYTEHAITKETEARRPDGLL